MNSLSGTLARHVKSTVSSSRGNLIALGITERSTQLSALCPDDEVFTLARELILDRIYERGGVTFSSDLRMVVDAGAHCGIFSLMVSQWAERVVAIEASQVNFDLLKLNVDRNHITNVDVRRLALWGKSGEILDLEPARHSGGGRVHDRSGSGEQSNGVESISLDDLIEELGPIDLLKIDIEGAEYETFRACTKLSSISTIVGEMHVFGGEEGGRGRLNDLVAGLEAAGFNVQLISESELCSKASLDRLRRNSGALSGNFLTKALAAAYYLAPIDKPIRRKDAIFELPLLIARRPTT